MHSVFDVLTLLTPYDIDKPKVRIGPAGDGGYVLADDFGPDQPVLSYGISTQYEFDRQMAERGHQVFMFDHTIEGIEAAHPNMHFFKQGVGAVTEPEKRLYSIADHIAMNGLGGGRILLKMDVEGAEYDALRATDDATLGRIEQIVIEIHMLRKLFKQSWRTRIADVLEKINRRFTLFHVHANNYDGGDLLHVVSGMAVPDLLELSYVNTDSVRRRPSQTVYPTELDYPNTAAPDKLLWFYPFMPTSVGIEAYRTVSARRDAVTA